MEELAWRMAQDERPAGSRDGLAHLPATGGNRQAVMGAPALYHQNVNSRYADRRTEPPNVLPGVAG